MSRRLQLMLWLLIPLGAVIVAAGGFWIGTRGATAQAMPDCPDAYTLVIDPGHGGIDGGTNVPGMLEKEIVLDVALRLQQHLKRAGVPVVLTRSADVDLGGQYDGGRLRRDLLYRVRVANQCRTFLMLSLHVNSTSDQAERGMMIFYQPTRPSRDAAYLFDHLLRTWPVHDRREQPIPRGDFAVLRAVHAPSLLIELGFITNVDDRALLGDEAYRDKVAQALASACGSIYHNWLKEGKR